jgi:predicted nuclease of predicted toxin-antitoxin system
MARLLFDQNLSHRLVVALDDLFPESMHVRDVGLARADDRSVWAYAKDAGLAIITKDGDFNQMSFVYGPPPKVVWLRAGNCTTEHALAVIRREALAIAEFVDEAEEALFIVDARA